MKYWALLFVLIAFVIPMCGLQSTPDKPLTLAVGSASVADVKGDVTVHLPDGASVQPQKASVLPADSNIETGKGSILLNLADGSQVLVKSHTRLQLKAPETSGGNFLQLLLGNIIATVQKRLGIQPAFRMGTPTAVITVVPFVSARPSFAARVTAVSPAFASASRPESVSPPISASPSPIKTHAR